MPPAARLRSAVRAFVATECAEAELRVALGDAAPLYRGAPEAEAPRAAGARVLRDFLGEALPDLPEAARGIAGDVMAMALDAGGERISERHRGADAGRAHADALADMLCAYLDGLSEIPKPAARELGNERASAGTWAGSRDAG